MRDPFADGYKSKIRVEDSTLDAFDIEVRSTVLIASDSTPVDVPGGGGIEVLRGSVTLRQSLIWHNINGDGGGIFAVLSNISLDGTTITDNDAEGADLGGGGIFAQEGTLTFFGAPSSITGNVSEFAPGGGVLIYLGPFGNFPATNVIVSTTPTISGSLSGDGDQCSPFLFLGCA